MLAVPDPTYEFQSGWMSRDGVFYPCEFFEHEALAYALQDAGVIPRAKHKNPELTMEDLGWLHIGALSASIYKKKASQAQLDAFFDLCKKHNRLSDYNEFIETYG